MCSLVGNFFCNKLKTLIGRVVSQKSKPLLKMTAALFSKLSRFCSFNILIKQKSLAHWNGTNFTLLKSTSMRDSGHICLGIWSTSETCIVVNLYSLLTDLQVCCLGGPYLLQVTLVIFFYLQWRKRGKKYHCLVFKVINVLLLQ